MTLPVLAAVETVTCYHAVVLIEVVKKRNGLSTLTLLCHETTRGSKEGQVILSTAMSGSEGAGRPTWKHSSPGSYGKVSPSIVKASIAPTVPLGHTCSSLNCVFASPGGSEQSG